MMTVKPKINILIDTNMLIRASVQPKEREDLQSIIEFAQKGVIHFIVSEIVIDEMKKHDKTFEKKLDEEIAKVSKGIREFFKNGTVWNDLYDFENHVVDSLYIYKGKKYDLYIAFLKEFDDLIKSENATVLKPNAEKFYETQRKVTCGEILAKASNDIHIIDCIKEICENAKDEDVYFVTENKKDFFEMGDVDYLRNQNGSYIIKGLNFDFLYGFISMSQALAHIKKTIGGVA